MSGARLSPVPEPARGGSPALWARRLVLPKRPGAVAVARAFTADALADVSNPTVIADAVLLVSELVANAVRHTGGPGTLLLMRGPCLLRIEVTDASTKPPLPRPPYEADETGGFGLFLLKRLSLAWGWYVQGPGKPGKTVWCDMRLPGR